MSKTDIAIEYFISGGDDWWKEKFASRILFDPVFGCHLWQGQRTPQGYGKLSVSTGVFTTMVMAHRVAYAKEYGMGKLPVGKRGNRRNDLVLDHTCFNPCCVNPAHLRTIPSYLNIYTAHSRKREKWEAWAN